MRALKNIADREVTTNFSLKQISLHSISKLTSIIGLKLHKYFSQTPEEVCVSVSLLVEIMERILKSLIYAVSTWFIGKLLGK